MDGVKCAHGPCSCYVDLGQDYCSPRCREMDGKDSDPAVHDRCGCHHDECVGG